MRGQLTKRSNLNSSHADAFHDHPVEDTIDVEFDGLPTEKNPFRCFNLSHYKGPILLTTSLVMRIVERYEGAVVFETRNSQYQLTFSPSRVPN